MNVDVSLKFPSLWPCSRNVLAQTSEPIKELTFRDISLIFIRSRSLHYLHSVSISLVPCSAPFSPFSHLQEIVWDSSCVSAVPSVLKSRPTGPRSSKYWGLTPSRWWLLFLCENERRALTRSQWAMRLRWREFITVHGSVFSSLFLLISLHPTREGATAAWSLVFFSHFLLMWWMEASLFAFVSTQTLFKPVFFTSFMFWVLQDLLVKTDLLVVWRYHD